MAEVWGPLRCSLAGWLHAPPPTPNPAGSSFPCLLQSVCPAPARGVPGVPPGRPRWGDQPGHFPRKPRGQVLPGGRFSGSPLPRLLPVLLTHPTSDFPFCPEASLLSTMPGIPDLGAPESRRAGGSHGYRVGGPHTGSPRLLSCDPRRPHGSRHPLPPTPRSLWVLHATRNPCHLLQGQPQPAPRHRLCVCVCVCVSVCLCVCECKCMPVGVNMNTCLCVHERERVSVCA